MLSATSSLEGGCESEAPGFPADNGCEREEIRGEFTGQRRLKRHVRFSKIIRDEAVMSRNPHLNDKTRLFDTHPQESQADTSGRVKGWLQQGSFLEKKFPGEKKFAGEKNVLTTHLFYLIFCMCFILQYNVAKNNLILYEQQRSVDCLGFLIIIFFKAQ